MGVTDTCQREPGSLADRLRARRTEMMLAELEGISLRLFATRGFGAVTVEEIAAEAHISVRTFYRYFPTKEDVLQCKIDRRAAALRDALAARPADEAPMQSLRIALGEVVAAEDPELGRQWTEVIANTTNLVRGVIGGIHLKLVPVIADFFAAGTHQSSDALEPVVLAAATLGVIQAVQTRWYLLGGNLVTMLSEALSVLERTIEPTSVARNHTS
jgi:TetR/AcrR family transcriptional regulator, regulator of mycofactocin system